jgi:hypothetical protein
VLFDPERLLLSRRLARVTSDPFCFFSVDDYLPPDVFETLRATFPDESNYRSNTEGKMGFRSSEDPDEVDRYCETHPRWRELIDFFGSDRFLADLRKTLAQPLADARSGWAGRRPWFNCTRREPPRIKLRYRLQEPVRTTFQFSMLPRDASVVPHSDAPRKLVSLMLYFAEPDWQDAWGGATEFYEPTDRERARAWGATDRIPFDEFKTIGSTPFVANRLAGFVRCRHSYHGVSPLGCPPERSRKALLVNVKRVKWSKRDQL